MIELLVIVSLLVLMDVVAVRFGADSRDGDDWGWRRHTHPARSRAPN